MTARMVFLVCWCTFWGFLVCTSYIPRVRDWWERD